MFQLNLPSTWDVSTKYTANNFSRQHFQMCFTGPSMGNSADADQMSPDEHHIWVSLLNENFLYPKLITNLMFYMHGDTTSYIFYPTVYFKSQAVRVLIYVNLLQ